MDKPHMGRKIDIITAVIVIVLVGILYMRINDKQNAPEPIAEATSVPSFEEDIESVLGREIDDSVEKIEVSSGSNRAVITQEENESGTLITVLADLEEIEENEVYQLWFEDGEKIQFLGTLENLKGGYLTEAQLPRNFKGNVIVSRESTRDSSIENRVLETTL